MCYQAVAVYVINSQILKIILTSGCYNDPHFTGEKPQSLESAKDKFTKPTPSLGSLGLQRWSAAKAEQ